MTQQDLADKINKERPLISHIETTGKVNYYTLQSICKALQTTPDELESFSGDSLQGYGKNAGVNKSLQAEVERLRRELKHRDELISTLRDFLEEMKEKKVRAAVKKRRGR
jgi:transcriptional regulator with XRE-family HTH domain